MHLNRICYFLFFFFNDTATTEIYTLSLHDALPISIENQCGVRRPANDRVEAFDVVGERARSEEHTSELQSPDHLVCRLLLEKKKNKTNVINVTHHGFNMNLTAQLHLQPMDIDVIQ